MGRIIGITGTPGTGKKSVSPLVAARLGVPCYGLNELASAFGLLKGRKGAQEVDGAKLRSLVLKRERGAFLVHGHLLPYVLKAGDIDRVIVLRCEPTVLASRLTARSYPKEKVMQNVETELIGTIAFDAVAAFGHERTVECDTTKTTPRGAAIRIAALLRSRRARRRIDWTLSYSSPEKLRGLLGVDSPSALT